MKKLIISLSLLLALGACATDPALGEHEQKLLWIEDADAQRDAKQALAQNDFRLMGLTPRVLVIPGVDSSRTRDYELKCGIRLIDGVTDVVRSQEHLRLMKLAHTYALQYNSIVKQRCQP
jgi:hypothetical protein